MIYEDLTPEQRSAICNGCGAKGGPFRPPQWHSRDTCDRHDFAYWRGGDNSDRKAADRALLEGMQRDAADRPWWQQPWYRYQAWLYYFAVRRWGGQHFHHCKNKRDEIDAALLVRRLGATSAPVRA